MNPKMTYPTRLAIAAALAAASLGAWAQDADEAAEADDDDAIEEVVVLGRFKAAATDVLSERIESDVPVDFLDAALIARVGDSNVASALRRVPGVTLVQDQFVYVRGLGERYSSSLLNGAQIPSPDLTRNVLPLDIFPAEIIDALQVTKGYSPDLPAAFGGGNINIRTKSIPEDAVFGVSINTGFNSESSRDGITYAGGGDDRFGTDDGTRALPSAVADGIQRFRGRLDPNQIQSIRFQNGTPIPFSEAQLVNRQIATSLNRNIDLTPKSMPADFEAEITGGYRWYLNDDWDFGFLALADYSNKWRNRGRTFRFVNEPEQSFADIERTINQVTLTGALNLGARFTDDHEINFLGMFLRNTEDEASESLACRLGQFNDCETTNDRERFQSLRFEERELEVLQFSGEHRLNDDTFDRFPFLEFLRGLQGTEASWFYTDSQATTDIPNETRVRFVDRLNDDGTVRQTELRAVNNAAEFGFADLLDDAESWGGQVKVPFSGDKWDLELSAGGSYDRKGRNFRQTLVGLGPSVNNVPFQEEIAVGTTSDVLSDANILNPDYGFELFAGIGQFGTESYAAGQITDAGFGKFDLLLNETWRISGGARWENFKQVSVPINYLVFASVDNIGAQNRPSRIPPQPGLTVAETIERGVINDDEIFPALALTYIKPGLWGDEFQLRFSGSETAARPDLREISPSAYIDPLTEIRVIGNPELVSSKLTNLDVRAEWFWDAGDNFTVSLFHKDIDDPIETVEAGATEDNIVFTFINAETATLTGIEFEALKNLGDSFYISGNATLSDSEVIIPPGVGGDLTNRTRRMTKHSEWVANLQLGYDSLNGRHGATLVYNAFGERIFFAGRNGVDDAFEQPFHSVDFVYSFFPTDRWTVKLRLQNLLDQTTRIDQVNAEGNEVRIIEQEVGVNYLLDLKYSF